MSFSKTTIQSIIVGFWLLVVWEHAGRKLDFYKASNFLSFLGEWNGWLWNKLGGAFALVSSFIHRLKLYEVWESLCIVVNGIWNLPFGAVYNFAIGYGNELYTYKYQALVVLGSSVIYLIPTGYILKWYNLNTLKEYRDRFTVYVSEKMAS